MKATNGCSDTLSGEHLISESVLGVLAEKEVTVSGLPWLKGQTKTFGFAALTAKCLCTRHNSLLSPIDTAGGKFFEAVQACGTTTSPPSLEYLLSGHDVERWLLRTLAVFGVSRNLAIDGAAIDPELVRRLDIVGSLENPSFWKRPLGLYVLGGRGHRFTQRSDVKMFPLLRRETQEIIGITVDIQGLGLLATDHDVEGAGLDKAFYRPGALVFDMGGVRHRIRLSWEDGISHFDVLLTWSP
ncbi:MULTISPECIES: hypothetical protein [unclassified Bradyrhizobium]|uniref:hypothetical protein n=1 Tax=unclassified Bradyrhizobium TaxID=2631580 RepID=UPI0029160713|nr:MULTISPECIES: hypothetical protein [unclassified Bradyrhizobium]